jgi:hypothetical protein
MRDVRRAGNAWVVLLALELVSGFRVRAQEVLPPLPPGGPSPMQVQPPAHTHQLAQPHQNVMAKLNPFRPFDPSVPVTIPELCKRLDCLTEELRDDGLIVLKQPDVFSQARLTRFRNDFDNQMSTDLGNFHLVLAARISRLDSATTTQTTALGAALSAPGTTHVATPDATGFIGKVSGSNSPFTGGSSLFGSTIDPKNGAFGNLGLGSSTFGPPSSTPTALSLGVDPTVYLDEKKRFLEHLNQIRRISQGPDQNDSSGYGLYLVRMPVSIQPGECTYQGYGADLSLNVEHEFPADFLPTTFQNLVINDLVDQLGPFLYETIRSGTYDEYLKKNYELNLSRIALKNQSLSFVQMLVDHFTFMTINEIEESLLEDDPKRDFAIQSRKTTEIRNRQAKALTSFILKRTSTLTGEPSKDELILLTIASRLDALAEAFNPVDPQIRDAADSFRQGKAILSLTFPYQVELRVRSLLEGSISDPTSGKSNPTEELIHFNSLEPFLTRLYLSAFPDDVDILNNAYKSPQNLARYTHVVAANNKTLTDADQKRREATLNLALPSSRSPKQYYPITPRELMNFFLENNIFLIAKDAVKAGRSKNPSVNDLRSYLRQTLPVAFAMMSNSTQRGASEVAPLADQDFMDRLREAIRQRQFKNPGETASTKTSALESLNDELLDRLCRGRDNVKGTPLGALCWAIAVDSAVLDLALRRDAARVLEAQGISPDFESVRFYIPKVYPNEAGREVFCDYVKKRWPIVTFSLDPVSDQQNIADTFNLKRDLQLATSFAFATGQISFNQLNTFRRQIEQSSDTIALNRTVTAFSSSNDNFGFRFTPRFQNPPNQRTNFGVIVSQLVSGGPGPDYQIKKSKLEPGMRELTAVLLIPDFLPTMRLNVEGNWFKLNDPEHLVFHTRRAMERGRAVQELRKAVLDACSVQSYRGDDLRVLQKKLAQLEAMLPIQSKVVPLPYDNMANGFDLLSDGSAALAPELTGFSGIDVINAPSAATITAAAPTGSTFPAAGANGVQLLTTTSPTGTTQTVSIAGGSTSIADIFVFGKFLNLLDTNVVAGGRSAAFQLLSREVIHVQIPANVTPTTTEDGKTYIEIYASTPNGISNTILVPYNPGTTPPPSKSAFDLAQSSSSFTVYYEPQKGADGGTSYIPSLDPGANNTIIISWDEATGIAPKRLFVLFSGTINNQAFRFGMAANASGQDDYTIAPLAFSRDLLKAIQPLVGANGAVPPTVNLTLAVQPFTPNAADNYRVRTAPKVLKTKMAVTLQYFAVGANALPSAPAGGQSSLMPPRDGQRLLSSTSSTSTTPEIKQDPDLARTSQQIPGLPAIPSLPTSLSQPQPPPVTPSPTLLAPNVANEAEQVARMLTGQPLPPNPSTGQTNTVIASASSPNSTVGQGSPIVVMPAPVVVVPAKEVEKKKHEKDRIQQPGFFKRLGNRMSNVMPSAGN